MPNFFTIYFVNILKIYFKLLVYLYNLIVCRGSSYFLIACHNLDCVNTK